MSDEGDDYVFAHFFLFWSGILWPGEKMSQIKTLITFTGKMIIQFFSLKNKKSDQFGKNADELWHMYAIPNNPKTCPVISLA